MRDITWMPEKLVLHRVNYESNAYKDFWGTSMSAYVVYERVVITRSDEVHAYNNGYEDETSYVYHDDKGRAFYHHIYVDGVGWRPLIHQPESKGFWEHRLSTYRRYINNGQPILASTLMDAATSILEEALNGHN